MSENFNDSVNESIHECGVLLKKFVLMCKVAKKHTFEQMKIFAPALSENIDCIIENLSAIEGTNNTDSCIGEIIATEGDKDESNSKNDVNDELTEIPIEKIVVLNNLIQKQVELDTLCYFLSNNLLVSLASSYDVFLSKMLHKVLFSKKMYGLFEKNISLKEALSYSTHDALISACIEDTLSELMRKSHKDHIKWIEKSFDLDIINSFQEWKTIHTFFALRNIIVHNDGIVNNEFLKDLSKNGISSEKYILGSKIEFSPEEFSKLIRCLIDFAIYLYSIILQKIYKTSEQIKMIDYEIGRIVYRFLCDEEYQQVISIVDNILKTNQIHSSADVFELNINKCIALKERKNDTYKKILDKLDWSNCDNEFRIARAILLDETDNAIALMETLDKDKMLTAYTEWPLFKHFIKTDEFKKAFVKIYGVEFEDKLSTLSKENSYYLLENGLIDSCFNEIIKIDSLN